MSRHHFLRWGTGLLLVLFTFLLAGKMAEARALQESQPVEINKSTSENFSLPWEVIANGGHALSSPSFRLQQTIGQAVIGSQQSRQYRLHVGFWQLIVYGIFLPLIQR